MNDRSNLSANGSAEWLLGTIKNKPEGLLLLAAGCALLMRTGSRSGSVSNVGDTVSEAAEGYVAATADYADKARRVVADQSGRIASQTQNTIGQIVREQPLAVALAGLAAGAAIAAAFPATQMERDTLGMVGKRATEAAAAAGQRVGDAASAARDQLKSAAEERGLNPDGLKEVARDVASTIGKSISGSAGASSGAEQAARSSSGSMGLPRSTDHVGAPVGQASRPDKT